jgi:hypothetical protein
MPFIYEEITKPMKPKEPMKPMTPMEKWWPADLQGEACLTVGSGVRSVSAIRARRLNSMRLRPSFLNPVQLRIILAAMASWQRARRANPI